MALRLTVALCLFGLAAPAGAVPGDAAATTATAPSESSQSRRFAGVPPLYFHWRSGDGGSSGFVVGPLGVARDPGGSTTTLFPLYWRFHDRLGDATTQIFFPLFGTHHHPGAAGAVVGPFYGWSSHNGRGGWGAGLFPLALFGRSGARSHALLMPLFGRLSDRDAGTATTVLGPLFWHTEPHGGDGGLFPLLFAGRRDQTRYALVPPLFYFRSGPGDHAVAIGPAYGRSDRRGWAAGLAPILFLGGSERSSYQGVPPLFWHYSSPEKSRLQVGLYYHGRDGAERTDVLFPLFYLRRAPLEGLGLWLLGGWRRSEGVETTVIGPVVHRTNAQERSRTNMIFPLLSLYDSPSYSVRALFPLFWRVRDGDEVDTSLIPFYFRGRAPGRGWDGSFPLFVHAYNPTATTTLVGPLWWRARKDGGRSLGLLPLFVWGKSYGSGGQRASWFGMPGFYHDRNDLTGKSHTWLLPFYHVHRPDGYATGLIPLAFAWRRGPASKVVTPIYYRQADRARDYSLDVLGPLYVGHERRSFQFGLFPLFAAARREDGSSRFGVFPLFYANHRADGGTGVTLPFGYSSYAGGRWLYAGPFYYRHDDRQHFGGLFPLIHHGHNQKTATRLSWALPVYLDYRSPRRNDTQLEAYTPLLWRHHTVESTTLVGLPLFFDHRRFAESRTTGVLPFVVRNRSEVALDTSYALPPLLFWWRTPDRPERGRDFVFFPLLWRFGGPRPTTVLAPFVWHFRRGESRTTVFAPIGAHWHRPDADHTLALNVYYRKGLGPRAGSWYLNVFPLFVAGHPNPGDVQWNLFEGLVGYSRIGRNRNLQLLWLIDLPLAPAPAANLAWFGRTSPSARELF